MTRNPGDPTKFIITVGPINKQRRFRTQRIISSSGAQQLRGRGARVFEAIEVDDHGKDKGPPVVLKDMWIDHDRIREGDIAAKLYEAANKEDKKLVKKHFLTAVCHGDVLLKSNIVDDTQGLMRKLELAEGRVFALQEGVWIPFKYEGTGIRMTHSSSENLIHPNRTHYRIVFKKKGVTIDEIRSLGDVMRALADVVTGALSSDYSLL
jgi:hypothetical protein